MKRSSPGLKQLLERVGIEYTGFHTADMFIAKRILNDNFQTLPGSPAAEWEVMKENYKNWSK